VARRRRRRNRRRRRSPLRGMAGVGMPGSA
jgi:hypothetical protein